MPTTPHTEDPAEGSRETVDRELNRTEASEVGGQTAEERRRAAGGESMGTPRTQEQIQADIDAGRDGDKTRGFDPAAVPMEADAEAGGFSTEASDEEVKVEHPKRQNEASTGNAMRPLRNDGSADKDRS